MNSCAGELLSIKALKLIQRDLWGNVKIKPIEPIDTLLIIIQC